MMAFQNTTRVYSTEVGRNRATGSLKLNGWIVTKKGQEDIGGHIVYTITCHKPWAAVSKLLRAMVAAKAAFVAVMNGSVAA
jgi:hypothetical protein